MSRSSFKAQKHRANLAILLAFGMVLYAMLSAAGYYNLFEYIGLIHSRGVLRSRSIIRFEENFDCLTDELDPAEPINFVTVAPPEIRIEYFQLTQYTLAPVLLEGGNRRPLVIAYVENPDDMNIIIDQYPDWQIIKSCGDSMILFRRVPE